MPGDTEQTLSYKLKLRPTLEQVDNLKHYFCEFSKAVNFYIKAIMKVKRLYEDVPKRNRSAGECSVCGTAGLHKWRLKSSNSPVCTRCRRASLDRKAFYSTRGRKRGRFDFRDCGAKISGTDAARAYDVAWAISQGLETRRTQLSRRIERQKSQLRLWTEVLNDAQVVDENGTHVPARFARPRKPNQRTDRYVHYEWRDTRRRGRSLASIRRLLPKIEREIKRLQKALDSDIPRFGEKESTMIKLQNSALKNLIQTSCGISLDLTVNAQRMQIPVELPRGLRKRSRSPSTYPRAYDRRASWFLDILLAIRSDIESKNLPYPLLWWNKRSDCFYFIYPLVRPVPPLPKPEPNEAIAIGIDRGVNKIAVLAAIESEKSMPLLVRFFSGKELIELKREDQWIRRRIQMAKPKNKKKRLSFRGKRVANISDQFLHELSKDILNTCVELHLKTHRPVVIFMEQLSDVRMGEAGGGTRRQRARLNYLLSNFTYRKLQSYLEYKSQRMVDSAGNRLPIHIKYVEPAGTSYLCSLCGTEGKRGNETKSGFEESEGGSMFICQNSNCALSRIHADLNAAINIARRGLTALQSCANI